jgi:hypothetical protein
VTRLLCLLFGHSWSPWFGDVRVCERLACRGRSDATDFFPRARALGGMTPTFPPRVPTKNRVEP